MKYQNLVYFVVSMLLLTGLHSHAQFTLESRVFAEGEKIPHHYVHTNCGGNNWPPPLQWRGMPEGTRSFALIVTDPDAPSGTFVHWVIYNIPSAVSGLGSSLSKDRTIKPGLSQGINHFNKIGYDGPCPPSGTHRYIFTLYALDRILDLKAEKDITASELQKAMQGHILGTATLMGRYSAS